MDDILHTISCIMYMAHLSLVTFWRHTSQSRSINNVTVSSVSSSSTSMSNSLSSTLNVTQNLLFVHYKVQSILSKLDTLNAELYEFDILAFTETLRKHAYSNIVKILPPKNENFQIKNSDIFQISAQNINCGYSLEPPRRGGFNEYPQSMF